MVKGKMKLLFAEIMRDLKASGYHVSASLMDAMYFRVRQSRQRMIFSGAREDPRRRGKKLVFQSLSGDSWNNLEFEHRNRVRFLPN